jgi:hypothetical protein
LTECGDLSDTEVEETEMVVVAVKTAEMAEALETAVVTIMMAVLTIKVAVTLVMMTAVEAVTALIEVVVTERAAAVYWRGCWFVSNIYDVRIMWNITAEAEVCIGDGDGQDGTLEVEMVERKWWKWKRQR